MERKAADSLEEEGQRLVELLGGRWTPAGGMCRCPAHQDHEPSLSVRPGRKRLLLHCFAGCEVRDVLRALETGGLLRPAAAAADAARKAHRLSLLTDKARRIWSEARSIKGTLAERYLASRGLHTSSPELRYHPRTPHGRSPLTVYRPALIAAVRDESGLVAIHRTFIDQEAPEIVAHIKWGLGRFGRGAVRFGGAARRLGLAEGIETALSATLLFDVPCWATLGVERFRRVSLPADVEELLLFLDNDAGGRRAEALSLEAFAQVPRIEPHYPPREGEDWNDVLRCLSAAVTDLDAIPPATDLHTLRRTANCRGAAATFRIFELADPGSTSSRSSRSAQGITSTTFKKEPDQ